MKRVNTEKESLPDPKSYALYLLSRRDYSVGQIRRKLKNRGYEEEIITPLFKKLVADNFLDDRRFARLSIEALLRRKPAGKAYIVAYLRTKFIDRELAIELVDGILAFKDEGEMAEQLLRPRWRYFCKFGVESSRRKVYNYLSRRSIGYEAAKSAFEKLLKEEND